jgi:predicted P-loop ATPase
MKKYEDTAGDGKKCLVELRCLKTDGSVGLQTVVPPSIHRDTGEQIRFEPGFDREPANVDADVLQKVAAKIAAVTLLALHWPKEGGRHDAFLALAGTLYRAGWDLEDALAFHFALYRALWGGAADRGACNSEVRTTYAKGATGGDTTGFPTLAEAVGDKVAKTAMRWLEPNSPEATVSTDHDDWKSQLLVTKTGFVHRGLHNAIVPLRSSPEWQGVLRYNQFNLTIEAARATPWGYTGPWTDQEDRKVTEWLQAQGIHAPVDVAEQAVQTVARELPYHPVRDYLDSLKWDGTQRIDSLLSLYFSAEPTKYITAVGSRWLVAAVARIYNPGCKADCCLILEGEQGIKKSTALKTIAGSWFTDEIADLGSKDAAMQIRGAWIIEISELDAMSRAEVGRIKAFMSRGTDRFRPPYGHAIIEQPRQCVFAGSVNHTTYLRDETGGRRFWPVACKRIRVDELGRDRDQLWAEAVARYRAGAAWWLDSVNLNRAAEQEQSARYEGGAWDELIEPWVYGKDSVSVNEVLTHCIGKTKDHWDQKDMNTVVRCLKSAGWEKYRERDGHVLAWRYRLREE